MRRALLPLAAVALVGVALHPTAAAAATFTVRVLDSSYDPARVTVTAGDQVRWITEGGATHSVTADDLSFDSGTMVSGQIFTVAFPSAGSFPYYCRFHGGRGGQGMSGVLTVRETDPSPTVDQVIRLAAPEPGDRIGTAVTISKNSYPNGGAASVVLSRSDLFADALAGAPLAVARNGPVLLTRRDALDERTRLELQRVAPSGATVFLLGGTAALSDGVADAVSALGYKPTRLFGATRAGTAAAICRALNSPGKVLEADGMAFPDALSAGAAAGRAGACVLLTNGTSQAAETADHLRQHPAQRWAIGGAAARADPSASPIVGSDRFDTAVQVAATFFQSPSFVGVASGATFPDGLAGGPNATRGGGPLLLVLPDRVPTLTRNYLRNNAASVNRAAVFGGTAVVRNPVKNCVQQAISNQNCSEGS